MKEGRRAGGFPFGLGRGAFVDGKVQHVSYVAQCVR